MAPEHSRMGQGMRRYRLGVRDPEDPKMFLHYPGERVLPKPSCLQFQERTERILRNQLTEPLETRISATNRKRD
jgi:hypothetical protein